MIILGQVFQSLRLHPLKILHNHSIQLYDCIYCQYTAEYEPANNPASFIVDIFILYYATGCDHEYITVAEVDVRHRNVGKKKLFMACPLVATDKYHPRIIPQPTAPGHVIQVESYANVSCISVASVGLYGHELLLF